MGRNATSSMPPCPACGSADVYLARTEEKGWHGHCAACSFDGPGDPDGGAAARTWDALGRANLAV